ncbi:peptide chain release factor-like protein [Candidatus Peregrinibacteria bacterium]|nr:peptide chain release factor-like protein [Candidatus Peregrinibacteria bacterium]
MPSHFPPDLPEDLLQEATNLGILPEDCEEHFIRGTGPGGQKKNKTSSCVELTHTPTGINLRVQKNREQHKNRILAYKMLIKKIEQIKKTADENIARTAHRERQSRRLRRGGAKEKTLRQKKARGSIKDARSSAWHKSLEE